jgi:hypothetical protein
MALVIAVTVFTADAGIFAYILATFGQLIHEISFASHIICHAQPLIFVLTVLINQSLNQASTSFFHLPVTQFHNLSTVLSHSS